MVGDRAQFMWLVLFLILAKPAHAMCPARCTCNDDSLRASCESVGLEVVPIQLNPELRHMNLSDNKITNVHFTLRFYHNLLTLDLSRNKIQKLESSTFESQRNLRELNLSRNEIRHLHKDSFKGLHNLTELDMSFNRLEEIAVLVFRELHSLRVLRLNNNQLMFLEEGLLKAARSLQELHLERNQLEEMPKSALNDAGNLQFLSLSQNLLEYIAEDAMPNLQDLRVLFLDNNVLQDIHPGALSPLTRLQHLDLSDNNFTAVPTGSLSKLSNLTKLLFSGNFINAVPPVAFRGLFQLKHLHLERLEILTKIDSRAFVDNINLEQVWLNNNIAVSNLPTRLFHGNPKLSHIFIRNNQLSTLEVSHFPLDQLKCLKLGGNPLQCNCSLLWLWRLEQEQLAKGVSNATESDFTVDIEYVKCAGPEGLVDVLLVEATESQVDCSLEWVAVVSAILSAFLLLIAASSIFYYSSSKRRVKKRELPPRENAPCPDSASAALSYAHSRPDKYLMGPPLICDYRPLPQWNVYSKPSEMDIYKQFDATNKKPHIVYV